MWEEIYTWTAFSKRDNAPYDLIRVGQGGMEGGKKKLGGEVRGRGHHHISCNKLLSKGGGEGLRLNFV